MVEGRRTQRHASSLIRLIGMIALLTLSATPFARAQAPGTPAGSVTTATGSVELQRAGATTAVVPGTAVSVGDRLITGPKGHAIVTLSDGSTLESAIPAILRSMRTRSPRPADAQRRASACSAEWCAP